MVTSEFRDQISVIGTYISKTNTMCDNESRLDGEAFDGSLDTDYSSACEDYEASIGDQVELGNSEDYNEPCASEPPSYSETSESKSERRYPDRKTGKEKTSSVVKIYSDDVSSGDEGCKDFKGFDDATPYSDRFFRNSELQGANLETPGIRKAKSKAKLFWGKLKQHSVKDDNNKLLEEPKIQKPSCSKRQRNETELLPNFPSFTYNGIKMKHCLVKITPLPDGVLLKHGLELNPDGKKVDLDTLRRGLFPCKYCSFRAFHKSTVEQHEWTHKKDIESYDCSECGYKLQSYLGLKEHINRTHRKKKPYACPSCDFRSTSKSAQKEHVLTHIGSKPFTCEHCSFSTSSKASLKVHTRRHTGEKPFACPHCPYRARQYPHLKQHLYFHLDLKPYECKICDFKTRQKSHLTKHILWVHCQDKPFHCSACDFTAKSKHTLDLHFRSQHTKEQPYKCKLCPFSTAHVNIIATHRKGHENKFSNRCSQCSWSCETEQSLNNHIVRCHPDSKTIMKCQKCSYCTIDEHRLENHLKIKHRNSRRIKGGLVVKLPADKSN